MDCRLFGAKPLCREMVCITVKWTWYNGRDNFFISLPIGLTRKKVEISWKNYFFLFIYLYIFLVNVHLKLPNHSYLMIENPSFFTIHKKGFFLFCFVLFLSKWPYITGSPTSRPRTHCLQWQWANARAKPVMTPRAFSRRNQHRAKALCWKGVRRKKFLVMLVIHRSIQQMVPI